MTLPRKDEIQSADRFKMAQAYEMNARGLLRVIDACDGSYSLAAERLTADVTGPLVEIAGKMAKTLAKVNGAPSPSAVTAAAENLIQLGYYPLISQSQPDFVQRGGEMAQAAFATLVQAAKPLNIAALTKLRQSVALEGARLAQDTEFWETAHRIVATVASMGLTEATAKLDGMLTQLVNDMALVNTAYRNAKGRLARDPRDQKARDYIAAYEANQLARAGNAIASGVGVSDKDLGLAGFDGLGQLPLPPVLAPPMVLAAPARYLGGGLAMRVGNAIVAVLQKIPGPWSKLATGGVAALIIGALALVTAILLAIKGIIALAKSIFGGSGPLGMSLFSLALVAGGGYFAYKKGYLAKIGLKPKGS
jgi:hypothetical protein